MKYNYEDSFMNYEIIGEGIPVVFLHGWGMNGNFMKNSFEPIFKNFAYQRIYLNLPGMGYSHAGRNVKNSDDMLMIIRGFIDDVIGLKTFMIVGESYGGYLARGLVHAYGNRISSMILLCPLVIPGNRKGNVEKLLVMDSDDVFLKTLSKEEYSSFTYMNVMLTKEVYERFNRDVVPAFLEQETFFLNNILDGSFTYDIDASFDNPVLILTGKQDTEVGYKDQFVLAQKYPNSTYFVCNKAGHNLQIEQPLMFSSIVYSWLKDK